MKNIPFLLKLIKEKKLELVDPSNEISKAYLEKADSAIESAKILLDSKIYENSVSMSYYAMYYSLTALLFKSGIKCENHSGAIILLKELFLKNKLGKTIFDAKKERIDKQYYIDFKINEQDAIELLNKAKNFVLQITIIIDKISNDGIKEIRSEFELFIKGDKKC